MGRIPHGSRALGTVMAAAAGEIIGSVGAGMPSARACCMAVTNAGR